MKALLVMAHGSPRAESNEDIVTVVDRVRERGVYPIVRLGYLDCNSPDLPTAIDQCVADGATEIVAVPYFLHTGKHVLRDLPDLLDQAEARHSHLQIRMGDYLGHDPQMADVLLERCRG